MCQFIESIRVVDGKVMSLDYHQTRVNNTLQEMGKEGAELILDNVLQDIPDRKGVYKLRIVYSAQGEVVDKTLIPYFMRQVHSLQLVEGDAVVYSYKSADRSQLAALVALKGTADEIIIVKDGLLTDTSYSNIALYNGKRWVTPAGPLLKGTMRQRLIDEGRLREADIRADELDRYKKICLINAMIPLGECTLDIKEVLPIKRF